MQQLFNNILKNPMLAGANNVAGGGPSQPPCIPQQIPSSNHPLMPGPSSSSSVPPTGGGDEGMRNLKKFFEIADSPQKIADKT